MEGIARSAMISEQLVAAPHGARHLMTAFGGVHNY